MNARPLTSERLQEHSSRFHSEFPEQSQNSLKDPVQERSEHPQLNKDHQSGVHSEFREASRQVQSASGQPCGSATSSTNTVRAVPAGNTGIPHCQRTSKCATYGN